jgi:rhodanese-related sulfurtransferase
VARKLIKMGFTQVYVLMGGWKEWKAAGYPVEEK